MRFLKIAGIAIVLLAVLFLGTGLFSPTIKYENQVTADRSVKDVWALFTDASRMGEWLDGLERVENVEGDPLIVGSRWKLVFEEDGDPVEVLEQVIAVEPERLYSFAMETDPFTGSIAIRFEAIGSATRITARTTMHGKGILWRAVLRLMRGAMREQSQVSYERLKKLAEAE